MTRQVEEMYDVARIPVFVKPNAGLPRLEDGKTVYDMGPKAFAKAVGGLAERGARLFGGCCGTTPEHIAAMARVLSGGGGAD